MAIIRFLSFAFGYGVAIWAIVGVLVLLFGGNIFTAKWAVIFLMIGMWRRHCEVLTRIEEEVTFMDTIPPGATHLEILQLRRMDAFLAWQKMHMRYAMADPDSPKLKAAAEALKVASDALAVERAKPENKAAVADMAREMRAVIAEEQKRRRG